MISTYGMPDRRRGVLLMDPAKQRALIGEPYDVAAMMLIFTVFIVGVFYCLDALYGERRDRSILFWKSLPVSDVTTVLSKAAIPLAILPLLVFAIVVTLQFLMFFVSTAVLVMSGAGAATLWSHLPFFQMQLVLLYGLTVLALWHAPIYAWLLLVSAWAKRATFLWAILPPLVIAAFEFIAFHTSYFGSVMQNRVFGFAAAAFELKDQAGVPIDPHFIPLAQLAPGKFLTSPGLWLGLIFAAICLGAAVRLRRNREPI
jgi:ABC-2 type transport system permease protein